MEHKFEKNLMKFFLNSKIFRFVNALITPLIVYNCFQRHDTSKNKNTTFYDF